MSSHIPLRDSFSVHPANSVDAGLSAPDEIIQISLLLRRKNEAPDAALIERHFSHEELCACHGADPADIRAVESFAFTHSFSVLQVNPAARTIVLSGKLSELAAAFGADVQLRNLQGHVFRSRQGYLHLPQALAHCVVAVVGFDQRPIASTCHRVFSRAAKPVAYTPPQVAEFYNFPSNKGSGQTIALIELGGGFKTSDLERYWKDLGLSNVSVTAVSVDGASTAATGNPDGPDGEVVLDIEVAGGVAPNAKIIVYFASNTDQGFLAAINAAIHDTTNKPSVISISWGAAEKEWTVQTMEVFNSAFHDAALLGISVCAAAGDNGSTDGENDRKSHVDFPASSPWVLACGGTRLKGSSGKILSETVWNDGTNGGATGGGVSAHFSRPSYQQNLTLPNKAALTGRGVPDVAGVADPESGYAVLVDGEEGVVGGTSAVAPLWAGLIALCNEQLGKNLGWFHNTLYGTLASHKALHDITSGTNGAYKAVTGWDACTGLGTPNGQAILNLLKQNSTK